MKSILHLKYFFTYCRTLFFSFTNANYYYIPIMMDGYVNFVLTDIKFSFIFCCCRIMKLFLALKAKTNM